MEFFIFALEQKLDQHSCVQFHGESDSDGFNFLIKTQTNPPCPLGAPRNEIFQLWARTKVYYRHFHDKFHGDFDGDGFKAE